MRPHPVACLKARPDVAVSVGTIFSVLRNDRPDDATAAAVLQPGVRQVAAGYVLYGTSTILVLTTGQGVDMYVLDSELAGGVAAAGSRRLLEVEPRTLHQRTSVMLGSPTAMEHVTRFLGL